ncbi:hypothetical protein CC1G_09157 [Coprinopsis cinerea okayama7|uniref:F-box domain-containing protein n=1 Tax=Coprinopsis cinerea (strain Okayama-7 / 130 / ATCC MYA-4618 / FGSC 9003) TaxID=240176 RepID=A8P9R9_COPC7|nr:hypothetical protein CC1G_09157 [Coprinopsis cinerea okayama7\|eukprot:XP_001839823.2 hypothetical protein CC1G_09157 [Coprinopsis cinerea okayama7\
MATRQSGRLKGKEIADYTEDLSSEDDELAPTGGPSGVKRKRKAKEATPKQQAPAKAGSSSTSNKNQALARPPKRRRGNRGALELLIEMPLDLLFEIFGKLDPADVLNLARASKDLRAILMSRSSAMIWREALSNVPDLPPCPDDLDEPTWVELAFGKRCQLCERSVAHTSVVWVLRFRACTRCLQERFNASMREHSIYELPQNVRNIMPSFTFGKSHHIWSVEQRPHRGRHFHTETFDRWMVEYKSLRHDPAKEKAWVAEKVAEWTPKYDHAKKCLEWVAKVEKARGRDLEAARDNRKECILKKLEGLGYSSYELYEKVDGVSIWTALPFKNLLKKDITDRAWNNVQEAAVAVAQRYRQARIERLNDDTIKSRYDLVVQLHDKCMKSLPINEFILSAGDLFLVPEVSSLLAETPLDQEMTLDNFNDIFDNIATIASRWESEARQTLLDRLRPKAAEILGVAPDSVTESALNLAFALVHRCEWHKYTEYNRESLDRDLHKFVRHTRPDGLPWNINCGYEVNVGEIDHRVAKLVQMGYDPKTVTCQELDGLGDIFECTACSNPVKGRMMLTWRLALTHSATHLQITKVDAETAEIIRGRMAEQALEAAARYHQPHLVCTHCRLEGTALTLRDHLDSAHGITDPTDDDAVVIRGRERRLADGYRYWKFRGTATKF